MKKAIILLSALLALVSCNKQGTPEPETYQLAFNIRVEQQNDAQTKGVKQGFEIGDVVYVFFEDVTGLKYVSLTKGASEWTPAVLGDLSVEDLAESDKKMYAVYFPVGNPVIDSDGGAGVTFKGADGFNIFSYYMTGEAGYTLTKASGIATLEGSIVMAIPENYVQFFISKNGGNFAEDGRYRISADQIQPVACASYSNGVFTESIKDYAQPMWGYHVTFNGDEGVVFSGKINDSAWSSPANHRLILFDTSAPAKSKVLEKSLSDHDAIKLTGIGSWPNAVAIPSDGDCVNVNGVRWAPYNVGASTIPDGTLYTDTGFYFAWGDLVPFADEVAYPNWNMKNNMSKANYYWYDRVTSSYCKYNSSDLKGTLEAVDDVARAYWGPDWRMPTIDEMASFPTDFVIDDGIKCLKKITAPYLYLPYSGLRQEGVLNMTATHGWYYSSSIYTGNRQYGCRLVWSSESGNIIATPTAGTYREYGLCIRPVHIVAEGTGSGDNFSWD